jgi:malonyl-CoA O-methyltransferase
MAKLLEPCAAYELWAGTYGAFAHNPLMQTEQAVVERLLSHLPSRRALDVGTGSGRYLPILASGGGRVVGVDLSMAMLNRAEVRSCVCADARRLPFRTASFDLVNASLMVGDIGDLRVWAAEMARVLVRGGHLVYSDFHQVWRERGWQRTFRDADGVLRAVAYEPHTIDDHLAALDAARFAIRAIREPRLLVNGVSAPVLAVFHAVKSGRTVP